MTNQPRIAITGASGFVGSQLLKELTREPTKELSQTPAEILVLGRRLPTDAPIPNVRLIPVDLTSDFHIEDALRSVDIFIHLAARAHVMHETERDPALAYRKMNLDATVRLATQARTAGVRRFVFLSSVKAVGEATRGNPWNETVEPHPTDPYGRTKLEAERSLADVCRTGQMTYAILRSPLVYGPGVRANFLQLIRLIERGIPLPFGSVRNLRSMVGLPNLVSALIRCAQDERAANQLFFVADTKPLSTAELIRAIATALNKKAPLIPFPVFALHLLGKFTGRTEQIRRLTGDLELDTTKIQTVLGWTPPATTDSCLKETIEWYQATKEIGGASRPLVSAR